MWKPQVKYDEVGVKDDVYNAHIIHKLYYVIVVNDVGEAYIHYNYFWGDKEGAEHLRDRIAEKGDFIPCEKYWTRIYDLTEQRWYRRKGDWRWVLNTLSRHFP